MLTPEWTPLSAEDFVSQLTRYTTVIWPDVW